MPVGVNPGDFGSGTVVSGGVSVNHTAARVTTDTLAVASGGTSSFTFSNSLIGTKSVILGTLDRTAVSGTGNIVLDSIDVVSGGVATVKLRNSDATSGHAVSGTVDVSILVD